MDKNKSRAVIVTRLFHASPVPFRRSSFACGFASPVDLFGGLRIVEARPVARLTASERRERIAQYWHRVGGHIRSALGATASGTPPVGHYPESSDTEAVTKLEKVVA